MQYPTSIRIRGHDYRIEYVNHPREVDVNYESDKYLGTCNVDTIRILAPQTRLALVETLVHEILHAIFIRNKMLKVALKQGQEENFVETLATEISFILLDNELVTLPKKSPPLTTRIADA